MGYSCRCLYETILSELVALKPDLVIAMTPVNHSSFIKITERYIKPENLEILELTQNYNKLDEKCLSSLKKVDVIVITHLFGNDLNVEGLNEYKKKNKCLIIEDRVQGGIYDEPFSNDVIDVSLYSMGMDKRPISLGGGYLHVKKDLDYTLKVNEKSSL